MKGLIFRNDASRLHDTGEHPERIERIVAAENLLEQQDWCGYEVADSPLAEETALLRAHSPRLIEQVRTAAEQSLSLDPDTPVVPASYRAALASAGGAVALVDALCGGSYDVGASLHRPPGHHAEADRSMGFCLFNNAAVAALAAIEEHGLERVLIFDWDVHHGNGTEAIFAADPRLGFLSAARDLAAKAAAGGTAAQVAAWQHQIFNSYVNCVVTGTFLVLVILILSANARVWWQLLVHKKHLPLQESPFVALAAAQPLREG